MGETIFRGYDRQGLDREYNNRGKVPKAAEYITWFAKESEAARRELGGRLHLRYGPGPAEHLDIFPAPGPGPAPMQLFIHGGYWMALDKADFSYVARAFRPAGAATVVINYALIPSVDMDELVRQCRAATAWIYRNAASLGGDPGRLFISGHSAGGHLVGMLMATDWQAFAGLPPDIVKGGCGISGLYDLEPIRLCYLNDTLGLTAEQARRNSPVLLAPDRSNSLRLRVGALEGAEYHRQTDDMAAAWRKRGLSCQVMDMPGQDHFSIVAQLNDPSSDVSRAVRDQMDLG